MLDAFSGDSVPVHLLTREAMDIYRKHVAPEDVIVIHATNSYLYLHPVVQALADDAQLGWRRIYMTRHEFRGRSDWFAISGNQSFLDAIPERAAAAGAARTRFYRFPRLDRSEQQPV